MKHRISVGALVVRDDKLLLARHYRPSRYDFWAPPGGGVENVEELTAAVARETLEETSITVSVLQLAYIDELIEAGERMVKFWYLADYIKGEIDISANPAADEAIVEAGWFGRNELPGGHVFPEIVREQFWKDRENSAAYPIKLPLMLSIF